MLKSHEVVVSPLDKQRLLPICDAVYSEALRSMSMFTPLTIPHEALGLILEEFEEFKDEVKAHSPHKGKDTRAAMKLELTQLAALCVRAIADLSL